MFGTRTLPHPLARIAALGRRKRAASPPVVASTDTTGQLDFRVGVAVALVYWAVVFVLDLVNDGPVRALAEPSPPPTSVLYDSTVWWSTWILATPLLVMLLQRLRPERLRGTGWAAGHVVVGCALATAHIYATAWLFDVLGPDTPPARVMALSFLRQFALPEVLCWWGLAGVVQMVWSRARDRAVAVELASLRHRVVHLESEHRRARLTSLHRELDEHFVLNTLNGLGGLVRTGEAAATLRMLERIGSVMRANAEAAQHPEVRLDQELELLGLYLGVEEAHRPGAAAVRYDIHEGVLGAAVPPFLLQPLVENALRYARVDGAPRLVVRGRRSGASLRLEVQDHGGRPEPVRRLGTGLSKTRARLEILHGNAADLSLEPTGDGMLAHATLPYRPLEEPR